MPATLSDVAREVGVATSTVADILRGRKGYSEKTRKRTLEAANKLNFVPNYLARSLQQKCSMTVGVLSDLSKTEVTGHTVKAITEGLLEKGYMPLFLEAGLNNEITQRSLRELRGRMVDGIILDSCKQAKELDDQLPGDFPRVNITNDHTLTSPCIFMDRFQAMIDSVELLACMGHRRISFLETDNVSKSLYKLNTLRLRVEGWQAGMKKVGLDSSGLLINHDPMPGSTSAFVDANLDFFRNLSAVFVGNDRIGIELLTALQRNGLRVPEDVSVIGYNDTHYCQAVQPTLSTFDPRRAEIGTKAVEMIVNLIARKKVESLTIYPELILRGSVCARA